MPQKARISFQDQITKNKIKSVILMVTIFIFFIIFGFIIALVLDPSYFFIVMIFSIIFSLSYTLISYYNSDKIALKSVGAVLASHSQYKQYHDSAENMALASGLPKPRLYVMKSSEINAFASGRNPQKAVMCFTTGALERLNKQELEGVIAHEMAHIANYDMRFMTVATVMIGLISIIAELFLRSLWFSNIGNDNKDGRVQIALILIGVFFAILAPIAANLVSLAISRKREYLADSTGVKLTRYPPGLANALKKIKSEHISEKERKHRFAKALAPLFISDPFKRNIKGLFATHPPIEERIRRLEAM